LCRFQTFIAELTLSQSMCLHVAPPFVMWWGCWKKKLCFISDVVAHLFLRVSALSVQDNEYVGPSEVFLLDSQMSSTEPERNKIYNIHVQLVLYNIRVTSRRYGSVLLWSYADHNDSGTAIAYDRAARQPVCTSQRNDKLGGSGSVAMM